MKVHLIDLSERYVQELLVVKNISEIEKNENLYSFFRLNEQVILRIHGYVVVECKGKFLSLR